MGRILCTITKLLLAHIVLLSYVCEGSSGVTSSFVRSEWPAIDIPLDNKEFVVPEGKNAPQQVHITQGDYDGKAVIVSWVTPDEPGSSTVEYGTSEGNYEFTAHGTVTNYTFYKYKSGYIHHCVVGGLEYDRKYYYKIGNGDSSRKFWFETPPKIDPDSSYKFGIIGDMGQTYNSLSTLEHYMESGAKAVLFVGDLSYADRYHQNDIGLRWDTWGRFAEKSAAYQPWIWTAGNHEIEYMPALGELVPFKSYLYRYTTPYAASQSSSPLWYAIRRASAHIIVLSSYSPFVKYTPQWKWLRDELKRVNREKTPWLIVLMHVPIYNSNDVHFMEGESMRAVFEKWFVRHRVDLVFAGHVHAYERSYRISNIHYNVSNGERYPVPDEAAPVYITVGDGGNQEGKAVLFVGDLSYGDKCPKDDIGLRWDTWGRFAEKSAAYQPWIWSAGNHEIEYMPALGELVPFKSYLNRYKTPYAASQSSSPLYYAIRRASAHIIVLSSYSPYVRYTPQWIWLKEELNKVDREKAPWLIVLMHVPMYNSNDAHFKEGESMRVVFEEWFVQHKVDIIFAGHVHAYERSHRISNIHYNVSNGERYPVPDKSAPIYITIGDGGNSEGLAGRFIDPQPEYSAFREASYGHATLEIMNRTHAVYTWHRNDDGKKVHVDTMTLLNQYWVGNGERRMLERPIGESAPY